MFLAGGGSALPPSVRGALSLLAAGVACEKVRNIWGKIENVGAPTFLGGVYPPVFADAGERKELGTRRVDVGEGKDLGEES